MVSVSFAKVLATFTSAALVQALAIDKRSNGVVKLDFNVTRKLGSTNDLRLAKPGVVSSPLENYVYAYTINLELGSDRQVEEFLVDTGSSDLWVTDSSIEVGGYDPANSTTFRNLSQPFTISYLDNSSVNGSFVTDQVSIPGGPTLQNLQFADISTNSSGGILGIGFENNESADEIYVNFPAALKNQGYISKNAYSLYLNDKNATSGSIVFGGIDTAKYESLTTVPFVSQYSFSVNFTAFTTSDGKVLPLSAGVRGVLDSGTSYTYVSEDIIQALAAGIPGAQYDFSEGTIYVPSLTLPGDLSITYHLLDATIKIPINDLISYNTDDEGNIIPGFVLDVYSNSQSSGYNILGDSFLRSAYVVFDLDDKVAQIGQVVYTTESNVVAIV